MERMIESRDIKHMACVERIKQLEQENKNLREERDLYKARNEELNEDCFGLANENKNLKEQIDKLIQKIDQLEEENENLRKDLFHLTNNGKAK